MTDEQNNSPAKADSSASEMPELGKQITQLLAEVFGTQRLCCSARLPWHTQRRSDEERRRMFESQAAHELASLMIGKAEWEKLFTLPTPVEVRVPDEPTEEWRVGFVVMTQRQYYELNAMVATLIRMHSTVSPPSPRRADQSEALPQPPETK